MAYQPLNYNTMPPALYTMGQPVEDEEQRRRREALEALARGESPTPVKQTITTDPITGEQKMKIEGSVQDLSAVNPMTPTVTGPAVPGMMDQTGPTQDEIMRDQAMAQLGGITPVEPAQMPTMAQPEPQIQPQPQPEPQPAAVAQQQPQPEAAPATPVPPTQLAAAPTQTRTDATQAAPATMAQPRVPFGAAIPSPSDQQYEAQGIQEGPTGRMLQGQIVAPAATNLQQILDNQNNLDQLRRLRETGNLTRDEQTLLDDIVFNKMKADRTLEKKQVEVREAVQNGDPRAIAKGMRGPEGSWFKAILLGALGASDYAREELNKMGIGGRYTTVDISDTEKAYVRTTDRGEPLEGRILTGPRAGQDMSQNELQQYATGVASKFKPETGGTYVKRDADGKITARGRLTTEIVNGRSVTTIESGGKKFAFGAEWEPESISTAAEKETARKQISLAYDPIIRAATTSAEELTKANIKYGTNFAVVGRDANNQPILVDQNTNQVVRPNAKGQINATVATARGAGVPAGGTRALETQADIDTTAGQEAVKSVETYATNASNTASAAAETGTVAKRIRTTIDSNPQVTGLLTKTNDKGQNLVTAALAAVDAGLGGSDAIEAAAKQLKLNRNEQAAFEQIKGDLTELALARARENKGQGTFTDFERRLFATTTGDIARNQARALQYRMEIFEYAADKARRKSIFIEDFRAKNRRATTGQINNAWSEFNQEFDKRFEQRLTDTYINPKYKVRR
jgi:hypothetical protein